MNADQPSVEEIRAVFRLVNRCCETWDDPETWQSLLLGGVMEILGASCAHLQLIRPGEPGSLPIIVPIAWRGLDSEGDRLYLESLQSPTRPGMPDLEQLSGQNGTHAFTRPMVVSNEVWYASSYFNDYIRPLGLDEFGMSAKPVPRLGGLLTLGGHRGLDAEPIPQRCVALLGTLCEEVAPLVGTRLTIGGQISRAGLTRRQRETLDLLLEGLSEKEVADRLGISRTTVHDYVVKLHRHFDVSSRGELLSYFVKRRPKDARGAEQFGVAPARS